MRITIRGLAVLIIVALGMALLHGAIEAASGRHAIIPGSPADIFYTRQVTGTVFPSDSPITPALTITSLWQTQFYSYSFGLPLTAELALVPPFYPTDSQIITYGITGGSVVREGQVITFVLTSPGASYFFDYLTRQQVVLEGNHYRVDQVASSNQSYRYISTLYFTQPYHYGGFSYETPTAVSSYAVIWDVVPAFNDNQRFRFDSSIRLNPYARFLPIVLKQH